MKKWNWLAIYVNLTWHQDFSKEILKPFTHKWPVSFAKLRHINDPFWLVALVIGIRASFPAKTDSFGSFLLYLYDTMNPLFTQEVFSTKVWFLFQLSSFIFYTGDIQKLYNFFTSFFYMLVVSILFLWYRFLPYFQDIGRAVFFFPLVLICNGCHGRKKRL